LPEEILDNHPKNEGYRVVTHVSGHERPPHEHVRDPNHKIMPYQLEGKNADRHVYSDDVVFAADESRTKAVRRSFEDVGPSRPYTHSYLVPEELFSQELFGDDDGARVFARSDEPQLWEGLDSTRKDAVENQRVVRFVNAIEDAGHNSYILPKELIESGQIKYLGTTDESARVTTLASASTQQAGQTSHYWDDVYDEFERLGGTKETLTSAPTLSKDAIHATHFSPGGAGWASEEEYLKWRYDSDGGPLARFNKGGPLHRYKDYKKAWDQVYEDSLPPKTPTYLDDISSLDDIFAPTPTPAVQAAAASTPPPTGSPTTATPAGPAGAASVPPPSGTSIGTPAHNVSTRTSPRAATQNANAAAQAQAQASATTAAPQARVSSTPTSASPSASTPPSSSGAPSRGTNNLLKAGKNMSASVASGTKGYGNLKVLGAGVLVGVGAAAYSRNRTQNSRQQIVYDEY
jgi:hypothetical protein